MRKMLLAVLLGAATLVHAQAKPATNMQVARPNNVARSAMQADPVVVLQRQVAMLQTQVKELKRQLDMVLKDSAAARGAMPRCSADMRVSSSSNGSRDCEPYLCDSVVGTCLMSCATSADCAGGFLCDIEAARCVTGR